MNDFTKTLNLLNDAKVRCAEQVVLLRGDGRNISADTMVIVSGILNQAEIQFQKSFATGNTPAEFWATHRTYADLVYSLVGIRPHAAMTGVSK